MTVKRNLTLRLDRATIRKAKALAAQKGTSISALVAGMIEDSVRAEEDAFEVARRSALEMLEQGFHLGGAWLDRDALQRT